MACDFRSAISGERAKSRSPDCRMTIALKQITKRFARIDTKILEMTFGALFRPTALFDACLRSFYLETIEPNPGILPASKWFSSVLTFQTRAKGKAHPSNRIPHPLASRLGPVKNAPHGFPSGQSPWPANSMAKAINALQCTSMIKICEQERINRNPKCVRFR